MEATSNQQQAENRTKGPKEKRSEAQNDKIPQVEGMNRCTEGRGAKEAPER